MRENRTKPTGNKIGSPKKYKCEIKTITISVPILAIDEIKAIIENIKCKYRINNQETVNQVDNTNGAKNIPVKKLRF